MSPPRPLEGSNLLDRLAGASRASLLLLFAGGLLALVGIAAVVWATYASGLTKAAFREVAGVALGLALPVFLGGVILAYPGRPWERGMAALAGLVILAGVAAFAVAYPYHWNVMAQTDHSPQIIVVYAAGLTVLGVLVFRALLRRFLPAGDPDEAPAITEEEIAEALEAAAKAKLTWGGVAGPSGPSLVLAAAVPAGPAFSPRESFGIPVSLAAETAGVGDATARLRALQGSFVEWSEPDGVAVEADALAALRAGEKRRRESGFWYRLKTGRLFAGANREEGSAAGGEAGDELPPAPQPPAMALEVAAALFGEADDGSQQPPRGEDAAPTPDAPRAVPADARSNGFEALLEANRREERRPHRVALHQLARLLGQVQRDGDRDDATPRPRHAPSSWGATGHAFARPRHPDTRAIENALEADLARGFGGRLRDAFHAAGRPDDVEPPLK